MNLLWEIGVQFPHIPQLNWSLACIGVPCLMLFVHPSVAADSQELVTLDIVWHWAPGKAPYRTTSKKIVCFWQYKQYKTSKSHYNNILRVANIILYTIITNKRTLLLITGQWACILSQCNLVIINLTKKCPLPMLFKENSFILLVQWLQPYTL